MIAPQLPPKPEALSKHDHAEAGGAESVDQLAETAGKLQLDPKLTPEAIDDIVNTTRLEKLVNNLPNDELEKLLDDAEESRTLLVGYLEKHSNVVTRGKQYELEVAQAQMERIETLIKEFEQLNKSGFKQNLNDKLFQLKQLEQEYRAVDQQLYNAIRPFQLKFRDNKLIENELNSNIAKFKVASDHLLDDISKNSDIKEDELTVFINEYKSNKVSYYKNQQILDRFEEDRIAGMI